MSKVCIINGGREYLHMFQDAGWEVVYDIEEADLVQFCGGPDVNPAYYGELTHPRTVTDSFRDVGELEVFTQCKKLGKPMAGICRGGQFLHVMNGGDLWQNVQNHDIRGCHYAHDVDTGVRLLVTSSHHQEMREGDTGLTILVGTMLERTLKEHVMAGWKVEAILSDVDVEAIYHKEGKCFCFQPHPEFIFAVQCRNYYFNKLNEFFGLG